MIKPNLSRISHVFLWLMLLVSALFSGCRHEGYIDENEAVLSFSVDTLAFDTVFTTMASTTEKVLVYNRSDQDVLLSSVTLAGGRASRFRLNVDGDTSMVARNVEIMSGDSIFIFVQANISPGDQTTPFVVEDAILFSNGQRLPLSAWGRDAVYHKGDPGEGMYIIPCSNWDHTRPHIIFDTAVVYTDSLLTLLAGDEIYMADKAVLLVYGGGTLQATGTAEQPVVFTSLRHDGWYSFLPGQWAALWFSPGSTGNILDHVLVEKGTLGIIAADTVERSTAMLNISNTEIRHMSYTGLLAQGARIETDAMLVYQCGTAALLLRGGDYIFSRSTVAGYWRYGGRTNPTVVLQNCYLDADNNIIPMALNRAQFTDCIIWGPYNEGELLEQQVEGADYSSEFINSIVRGGEWDEDPLFVCPDSNDYRLQPESPAIGIGFPFETDNNR